MSHESFEVIEETSFQKKTNILISHFKVITTYTYCFRMSQTTAHASVFIEYIRKKCDNMFFFRKSIHCDLNEQRACKIHIRKKCDNVFSEKKGYYKTNAMNA